VTAPTDTPASQLARFDAAVAAGIIPDAGPGALACTVCPLALSRYPAVLPDAGTDAVYLLCFSQPFGHARHYLGYASDLRVRLTDHFRGNGASAKLLKAAHAAGVRFTCVRWWQAGYRTEQAMKHHQAPGTSRQAVKGRHGARTSLRPLCPRCTPGTRAGRIIAGQPVVTGWTLEDR
jgi:predicted GIY-YIG superfamily endonuclease